MRGYIIFALMLVWLLSLPACGGDDESADGGDQDKTIHTDGDTGTDGDTVDGDEDLDPDIESDDIVSDGDDELAESVEEEIVEQVEEDPDLDPDTEIWYPEEEPEPEQEIVCEEDYNGPCFDGWSEGLGTKCSGSRLVQFTPLEPQPPLCEELCEAQVLYECEGPCIDPGQGDAYCGTYEGDGDEVEDELEQTEEDEAVDGDLENPVDGDVEISDVEVEPEEEIWVCTADGFEPNEGLPGAIPISPGINEGYTICADDQDWFWIYLAQGDQLTVRTEFINANGDLNLFLVNDQGQVVQNSTSSTEDFEEVAVTAGQSGTYYFFVTSYGGMENIYNLDIELLVYLDGDEETEIEIQEAEIEKEIIQPCLDDPYEPNDTRLDARPVGAVSIDALYICPNNEDWYSIELQNGDYMTADITFQQFYGVLELKLYGSDGGYMATGMGDHDGFKELSAAPTSNGVFYLLVKASDLRDDLAYNLTVEVEHNQTGCTDDSFEDNDILDDAALLSSGSYSSMYYCAYDYDWYRFDMQTGQDLDMSLLFSNDTGNMQAELYDSEMALIDESKSMSDNEYLYHHAEADESVYAMVYGMGYMEYSYQMSVQQGVFEGCDEDGFEDNDTIDKPHPLASGNYPKMAACSGDSDYLKVSLETNNLLTVSTLYETGGLSVKLYDDTPLQVIGSTSIEGGRQVVYTAEDSGDYILEVVPTGADTYYDLTVDVCSEDTFEPNDRWTQATFVPQATTFYDMGLCRNDEDWFQINLWENTQIHILLQYQHKYGDLDIFVRDGLGQVVAQSATQDDNESLFYTAENSTSYYVQVKGYEDAQNSYVLSLDWE